MCHHDQLFLRILTCKGKDWENSHLFLSSANDTIILAVAQVRVWSELGLYLTLVNHLLL
jgi:hypothetical protein